MIINILLSKPEMWWLLKKTTEKSVHLEEKSQSRTSFVIGENFKFVILFFYDSEEKCHDQDSLLIIKKTHTYPIAESFR